MLKVFIIKCLCWSNFYSLKQEVKKHENLTDLHFVGKRFICFLAERIDITRLVNMRFSSILIRTPGHVFETTDSHLVFSQDFVDAIFVFYQWVINLIMKEKVLSVWEVDIETFKLKNTLLQYILLKVKVSFKKSQTELIFCRKLWHYEFIFDFGNNSLTKSFSKSFRL